MNRVTAMSLVVTLCFTADIAAAINPPLERPTPPPCCADGVCYAHARTYGYFQTRWRTWPGLGVAPMPTLQTPPSNQIPGFPTYETPTPEKEDLQAPPLTKASPETSAVETPGALPQTKPLETPALPIPRPTTTLPLPGIPQPTLPQPALPQPTGTQPSVPRPATTPLGELKPPDALDPPPAPPSYTKPTLRPPLALQQNAATTTTARSATRSPGAARTSPGRSTQRTSGDPPPPPPLALGSASRASG
ncbi:MAG: hypothetical protein WD669_11230 [Pirellulales bacterium]